MTVSIILLLPIRMGVKILFLLLISQLVKEGLLFIVIAACGVSAAPGVLSPGCACEGPIA